jgi:hypothetical protein
MAILSAVPPDKSVAKTCTGAFGFGKEAVTLCVYALLYIRISSLTCIPHRSMKIADLLVFLYPNSGPGNTYSDSEAGEHRPRATFIVEVTVSIAEGSLPPPPIRSLTVQLEGLESMKVGISALPKSTSMLIGAANRSAKGWSRMSSHMLPRE